MAIFHCQTKPLSRSSGRSAVAAIAYRSGVLMRDERQGLTHDYARRSGGSTRSWYYPMARASGRARTFGTRQSWPRNGKMRGRPASGK